MNAKKKIATIITTAAAIAFISAPLTATIANAGHKVKCYGLTVCKDKKNVKVKTTS